MTFCPPPEGAIDPRPIMRRLIDTVDLFETIRVAEADIMVIMRTVEKVRQGKKQLGQMAIPGWQGSQNDFGLWLLVQYHEDMPDFIMTLDMEFWEAATEVQREALVFHELMHCGQAVDREGEPKFDSEGLPVWAICGHDLEEFNEVAARYGAWLPDVQAFLDAAQRGRNDR